MNKRNSAMDFYKLFFTFYVVLYHSCIMVTDRSVAYARGGWLAVEFFFIVSGFLMVSSANRLTECADRNISIGKETFDFVLRKIKIIFPYYLFAYVSSFIIMHLYRPVDFAVLKEAFFNSIIPFFFLENTGITGSPVVGATWYLSAMFIAMFVIFPILLKNKDYFLYVFSPLIVVMGYGYMIQTFGGLPGQIWHVLSYGSTLRAFTGLCLGAVCYLFADNLSKKKLHVIAKIILTILEMVLFCTVSVYLWKNIGSNLIKSMLLFSGLIVLSFSGQTYISCLLGKVNTKYVAQFSICLYLCHGRVPGLVKRIMQTEDYIKMLPYYVLISVAVSGLCFVVVNATVRLRKKYAENKI